ncbi:MAG: MaoC family dehydratase N-terminal domain-containing protein [Actinobacteria bacterium]|nr:MaoC family dehydratase N-terminal domain-containing protein [Actinomycetota bacterium]MBU2687157.1 MaoC family dehydratase N-terminal domain-containing protein [Actinomycetota bacterium]
MPLDVEEITGAELAPLEHRCTPQTFILYALGVGAGVDPDDLRFCYEGPPGLAALPTFGTVPSLSTALSLLRLRAVDVTPMMLIHGEQHLHILRQPPVPGSLITRSKVKGVFDKGTGALIEVESETRDGSGDIIYTNVLGTFVPGEGGFGGDRGPAAGNEPPDRDPDRVIEMATLPQQALLFRLSGEVSPLLHLEQEHASRAGYEKPILHGICTLGFAGRAILREFCDNDPRRFASVKARFSGHVYPGETLLTEMWDLGGGEIVFRVRTRDRGAVVVSNAVAFVTA